MNLSFRKNPGTTKTNFMLRITNTSCVTLHHVLFILDVPWWCTHRASRYCLAFSHIHKSYYQLCALLEYYSIRLQTIYSHSPESFVNPVCYFWGRDVQKMDNWNLVKPEVFLFYIIPVKKLNQLKWNSFLFYFILQKSISQFTYNRIRKKPKATTAKYPWHLYIYSIFSSFQYDSNFWLLEFRLLSNLPFLQLWFPYVSQYEEKNAHAFISFYPSLLSADAPISSQEYELILMKIKISNKNKHSSRYISFPLTSLEFV